MRTFLTMLGVIIGVAAVITMVAIAQGARKQTMERIESLGTNVMSVVSGQARRGGAMLGFGSTQTLTVDDAEAILKECSAVGRVSPETSRNFQVKYQNSNTLTNINAVGQDHSAIRNLQLSDGRFINEREVRTMARVAVLGDTVWQNLFNGSSAVGKRIRIGGSSFEVIGVAKPKGGQDFRNPDDAVYIPVTTGMKRLMGVNFIRNITVQARAAELMNTAQQQVEQLLIKRHKLPPNGDLDFRIFNQAEFAETAEQTSATFTFLLAGVALVSLLVGGIGIMNIMLVSVTERTREIGLRKAIGAKRLDILLQFMIESFVMSALGGALGILLGFAAGSLIGQQSGWELVIPPWSIAASFGFAAFIGIFFGLYPAVRASGLQPIEALRYE